MKKNCLHALVCCTQIHTHTKTTNALLHCLHIGKWMRCDFVGNSQKKVKTLIIASKRYFTVHILHRFIDTNLPWVMSMLLEWTTKLQRKVRSKPRRGSHTQAILACGMVLECSKKNPVKLKSILHFANLRTVFLKCRRSPSIASGKTIKSSDLRKFTRNQQKHKQTANFGDRMDLWGGRGLHVA